MRPFDHQNSLRRRCARPVGQLPNHRREGCGQGGRQGGGWHTDGPFYSVNDERGYTWGPNGPSSRKEVKAISPCLSLRFPAPHAHVAPISQERLDKRRKGPKLRGALDAAKVHILKC